MQTTQIELAVEEKDKDPQQLTMEIQAVFCERPEQAPQGGA